MGAKPRKKGKPVDDSDSIDTYFNCVSDCSITDKSCTNDCVDELKDSAGQSPVSDPQDQPT